MNWKALVISCAVVALAAVVIITGYLFNVVLAVALMAVVWIVYNGVEGWLND